LSLRSNPGLKLANAFGVFIESPLMQCLYICGSGTPDPEGSGVADLPVGFDRHGAGANPEISRQPENYLSKVAVRHRPHGFCRYVKALVVAVKQIDDNCARRFARGQLKICYENNDPRVAIAAGAELAHSIYDRKRISTKRK